MSQKLCFWFEIYFQVPVQVWILFLVTDGFVFISEKPQEEKKDTFVEKLATQVIKNLQVKISRIHLRYEDDVSTYPGPGLGSDAGFCQCLFARFTVVT